MVMAAMHQLDTRTLFHSECIIVEFTQRFTFHVFKCSDNDGILSFIFKAIIITAFQMRGN